MSRYIYAHIIALFSIVMSSTIMAQQRMIIPQWNSYRSEFRETSIENGVLTDSYHRQGCDTVNVIEISAGNNYSLNISIAVTNLHNNPYTPYGTSYRTDAGKVKRGKSVKRPAWGWVIGMKDMLNYNAILLRPTATDDILYSHNEIELCLVSIVGGDTIYHSSWQRFSYDNRNTGSDNYNLWMQYKNGTLKVGGGWNIDMPLMTFHNVRLYGNQCGLYLSAGAKVRVDDAMIIIEEQELPTLTEWNEQRLIEYFSHKGTSPVEGLWEVILDSRRKDGVKMGGSYKLGIVAHDDYYNIIYLSGAKIHPKQWKEGMLKGRMYPTISGNYKVEWFDAEQEKLDNILAFPYGNDIKLEFLDENTMLYLTRTSDDLEPRFTTNISCGSGFALDCNGYIATNYHVIKDHKRITVSQMHDMSRPLDYHADVVVCDTINDIAILRINDESFKAFEQLPYCISDRNIRKGEEIFYMGYPVPDLLSCEIKTSDGRVTAIYGFKVSQYMMSIDVDHGSSGSPVFDSEGNIIGIVVAMMGEEYTNIEANFAIKIPYLFRLMGEIEGLGELPTNKIKGLSHPDKIEAIAPYVFFITVER